MLKVNFTCTQFDISDDSRYFVTGTKSVVYGWIILWNYETMIIDTILGYHDEFATDVDFSPDGKYIASAGNDGYIKIWDIENRNLYKSFIHDTGHLDVETVKFSPDSKYFVSGNRSGNLYTKIWNLETGNLIKIYNYGAIDYLDVDINAKYIIATAGGLLFILNAKWEPNDVIEESPKDTVILYPNPSDNVVNISYENSNPDIITVKIFNTSGQNLSIVHDGVVQPGKHLFKWNTTGQPSGTYFCKITGNRSNLTYKIIIAK
ncbi:MAG: hypothetical protein A2X61_15440 [Ignavibacteria bacterium GWB2_35_12]|nr:MAG: hypothetical protein A2X61_15440 [Ignavibacteria bacterium GWB2_35_12]OGU88534.1 MAG: hypothetical protein A2220_06345 [Ignavibacteria bacterium RIFOXYA2_FULL_35_10]OGV20284.1 MAG: hypothetical protein A2475_12365 [Ignavibacteria bacterium RIFOXYC2_FULL_35_21]